MPPHVGPCLSTVPRNIAVRYALVRLWRAVRYYGCVAIDHHSSESNAMS